MRPRTPRPNERRFARTTLTRGDIAEMITQSMDFVVLTDRGCVAVGRSGDSLAAVVRRAMEEREFSALLGEALCGHELSSTEVDNLIRLVAIQRDLVALEEGEWSPDERLCIQEATVQLCMCSWLAIEEASE